MKEWKIRQQLYHDLEVLSDTTENTDHNIIVYENITDQQLIDQIVSYMSIATPDLIYPAKSYAVAIIYAKLLQIYFNEDFYQCLSDPSLLFNNDKYFVPYLKHKNVYDQVLSCLNNQINFDIPQLNVTKQYFIKEFMVA